MIVAAYRRLDIWWQVKDEILAGNDRQYGNYVMDLHDPSVESLGYRAKSAFGLRFVVNGVHVSGRSELSFFFTGQRFVSARTS